MEESGSEAGSECSEVGRLGRGKPGENGPAAARQRRIAAAGHDLRDCVDPAISPLGECLADLHLPYKRNSVRYGVTIPNAKKVETLQSKSEWLDAGLCRGLHGAKENEERKWRYFLESKSDYGWRLAS